MNESEITNNRIKKLLKEDDTLRAMNDEFKEKWSKETIEIMCGKRNLTAEMIREKIDWIKTLIELSNIGKENERL